MYPNSNGGLPGAGQPQDLYGGVQLPDQPAMGALYPGAAAVGQGGQVPAQGGGVPPQQPVPQPQGGGMPTFTIDAGLPPRAPADATPPQQTETELPDTQPSHPSMPGQQPDEPANLYPDIGQPRLERTQTFRMATTSIRDATANLFRNVVGQAQYKKVQKIPDGFELRHLPNGVAYYHKLLPWELKQRRHDEREARREAGEEVETSDDEEEDEEAANEYANYKKASIFCTHKTLEKNYGIGVRLYFDFALILLLWNLLFFVLQLIPTIFNFAYESGMTVPVVFQNDTINGTAVYHTQEMPKLLAALKYDPMTFFFVAHWDDGVTVWVWMATNIVIIVISILIVAPCYYCFTVCIFKRLGFADAEGFIANEAHDRIEYPDGKTYTKRDRVCRVCVSYLIFVVIIVLEMAVVVGLTFANNLSALKDAIRQTVAKAVSMSHQSYVNTLVLYTVSFGISIVVVILNTIWKRLCGVLTSFEKHKTYSTYRKHHTLKLNLFQILNMFFVGMMKGFLTNECIMNALGTQYLVTMIMDCFILNIFEIGIPLLKYCCKRARIEKGPRWEIDKNKLLNDFDVSDEYYELIYRQYVIYVAMPSFPYVSLFAVVASGFELIVDKIKLIYLSKPPPDTRGSVKSVVCFFLFFAALMAAINWGGGSIYTMSGYYWCNDLFNKGVNKLPCHIIPQERCVDLTKWKWGMRVFHSDLINKTAT